MTVTDQTTLSNATGSVSLRGDPLWGAWTDVEIQLLGALGKYGASGQGLAGAFISVGTQLLALGTSFDNVNNAMAVSVSTPT